jgi:3-hydroxyisobutyrate dehydrogenase-like beta-hydroxyacid dehydrogenase
MSIGQCGLGNIGLGIATRLRTAGPVYAYDPSADRRRLASSRGITVVESAAEVASRADTVVMSLPSPAVSHGVLDELLTTMPRNGLVIEMSTVAPSDALAMHERCSSRGVGLVDAAVLGGVDGMAKGQNSLLVGGEAADVERAQPVLDTIAARTSYLGRPGAGMAAKVINNAVAHAVYVVYAEAAAMGSAAGIPLDALVELLADSNSGVLRPLIHRLGQRVPAGDYEDGMPTYAAYKDSLLALQVAQDQQIPLFAMQAAHTVYEIARSGRLGRLDYAAVATLWEEWTGRRIG